MVDGSRERGQTLIIFILLLVVLSLIVLAVSARSITNVKISETSEESARAFSSAEAGIEEAVEQIRINPVGVVQQVEQPIFPDNRMAGTYKVNKQAGSDKTFLSSVPFTSDLQTLQVLLADNNDPELTSGNYRGNSICLLWGDERASERPAIEATVIYLAGDRGGGDDDEDHDRRGETHIAGARFAVDPNGR